MRVVLRLHDNKSPKHVQSPSDSPLRPNPIFSAIPGAAKAANPESTGIQNDLMTCTTSWSSIRAR
jgi:hypothetical protein